MGESVFTIGYPTPVLQGASPKFTRGDISSLTGFQDDPRIYQISVPVQPGNSGGPLVDMQGNVKGIVLAVLDAKTAFRITGAIPQNVNYAIKGFYAQALVDSMPDVARLLLSPNKGKPASFDVIVDHVKACTVMVFAYGS